MKKRTYMVNTQDEEYMIICSDAYVVSMSASLILKDELEDGDAVVAIFAPGEWKTAFLVSEEQ